MSVRQPTVSDPGFVTLCIQLAQSTFSDVMPAKSESRQPPRPSSAVKSSRTWLEAIDNWLYRQQVQVREDYLAQSADIFELERRMRHLEARPYY
jgi:hypothetical protein